MRSFTMLTRMAVFGAILVACCLGGKGGLASKRPQIWFSAVDPIVQRDRKTDTNEDYMGLFGPGAPWRKAASTIDVFEISTQFAFSGDENSLRALIGGLAERKIALAISGLVLPGGAECGRGVEGYAAPGWLAAALRRLKGLGAEVRYIAMDEPLWFGHYDKSKNACRAPIEDVAREVATTVRQARTVYPQIAIGDVEPVSSGLDSWPEKLFDWAAAYRVEVGEPLAFLGMDVQWQTDVSPLLHILQERANAAGLALGVIYNGDARAKTSGEWVRTAEQRFVFSEQRAGLRPDLAMIATWDDLPKHVLPETDPDTMTYLVNQYHLFRADGAKGNFVP